MNIQQPIIPLSVPVFKGNEKKYVVEAIDTEWVSTAGPFVERFEREIASYVDSPFAVATANGTAALHLALIQSGVGKGHEVIVPTITFISPINVVRYTGAEPLFMDCDEYLNMDVAKVEEFLAMECDFNGEFAINKKSGKQVKAIIPVHVFGHPVDLERLLPLAQKYNLTVIEDATESLGSYYNCGLLQNRQTGTIGHIGCFSFNGNKLITTGGGGMIVCNDKTASAHMKYLTTQAKDEDLYYIHNEVGYNYRMTNLQAALGVAQLENIDAFIRIKRENFETYKTLLNGFKGLRFVENPPYAQSNYWFYSLVMESQEYGQTRDQLMNRLRENNIKARPLWYLNHLQKPFEGCQSFKIEKALYYYERILNLPCSVNLTLEDIQRVVAVIKQVSH